MIFILGSFLFPEIANEYDLLIKETKKAFNSGNVSRAIELSKKLIVESDKRNDYLGKKTAYHMLGEIYYDNDYDKSIKYYKKYINVLKKEDKEPEKISYAYNVIGLLLKKKGKYKEALDSMFLSLEIARQINNGHRMAVAYSNIGLIFRIFKFYDKSIYYHKKSIEAENQWNKDADFTKDYINIAMCYENKKDYENALFYYKKALDSSKKHNALYERVIIYNNLGAFYIDRGADDKAFFYYKKALELSKKGNYDDILPYIYSGMGELFLHKKELKKALKYELMALHINKEDILKKEVYRLLSKIYLELEDSENAKKYFNLYLKSTESRTPQLIYREFERLIVSSEIEKAKQRIEIYKREKKIQKQIIEILILLFSIAFLVGIVFILKYYYSNKVNKLLEELSRRDPLTKLDNRRAVIEKLEFELKKSKRTGEKKVIGICDIDDFKRVNDTYGHNAGDDVLKGVSNILRENLREVDIKGRWGGEEFIVVLNNTSIEDGKRVFEKLKDNVSSMNFHCEGKRFSITITCGICEISDFSKTINEYIDCADKLLYYGKKAGKNRVVF